MPALNWDAFAQLPESPEKNFELLCRGAVRHNFGGFGVLCALANQPGVEFHLKLNQYCGSLGDPERWWGWQCKWYVLPANSSFGAARRRKIEEGIRKTETHVPGVTDWVLWTRRPLTSSDQQWFKAISSKMTLHLWTADDLDNLLVGQAAILRGTYFGELMLTPETLREQHEQAVASIRSRWQSEVHHVIDAERELRRNLGESDSWDVLHTVAKDLRLIVQRVEDTQDIPPIFAPLISTVTDMSKQFADALELVVIEIHNGDLDLLRCDFSSQKRLLIPDVFTALRRLRSVNHPASLYVTNAIAGCREALRLLTDVESALFSRVVAVLASAGYGKTQLAAQLTASTDERPHGVLLHGRELHANHTLDDLARRVSIAAQAVPSIESLLAAVDAAGQRACHRLPIVIDGLNESEDPRLWKSLLATLETMLLKYPYVFLVCMLRPEFADEALPDEIRRLEIDGYGQETVEAIREHFSYWKIDATDAAILPGFFRHPLTLRIFCEVTNKKRQEVVGIAAMPGSLTAMFDRYLSQVGDRIAELAPRVNRYYAHDVRQALMTIANSLWASCSRSIDIDALRQTLGDERRPWDQSLVRALEHEGVLLRIPSNGNGAYMLAYDQLGGHVIASALLAMHGQVVFEAWIRNSSTTTLLSGDYSDRHPLADDILYSLSGQIPRRFHSKQLWQLVDEPLRFRVLRFAAKLEVAYLDAETVDALLDLVRQGDSELLKQLWELRGTENHPLNAEGLDIALRSLDVANRDQIWTEWIRKKHDKIINDLEHLEQRWQQGVKRTGDRLRARWVMWTLTSTVRRLRDQATRSLYWFGRGDTKGLFELTIDSLSVNDAYVSERMLAASYGVVMSYQQDNAEFKTALAQFLGQLTSALIGTSATVPTHHYLVRLYVRGIITFSKRFYAEIVPYDFRDKWVFAEPTSVSPIEKGDVRTNEVRKTLNMDFENYTLGHLCKDRSNYDMNHKGHQAAVAYVCGVVWSLGWRAEKFETLDRAIAQDAFRSRGNRPRVERYGKKYGWIGYFTYAGQLEAHGLFPIGSLPFSAVDIDPSFPAPPPIDMEENVALSWLSPSIKNHEPWIRESSTSVPLSLLVRQRIGEYDGPWVAVHGCIKAENRIIGREVWGLISALVTSKHSESRLITDLNAGMRPCLTSHVPTDYYTFAGEIPWHQNFAAGAFAESDSKCSYREEILLPDAEKVDIEVLAHRYMWESYHSVLNRVENALVPSRCFSSRFDLRGVPQSFDQILPDGTRATITLSGIDGLDGDILYIRADLLKQYVNERAIIWFAFGERNLCSYPSSPPQWLSDAHAVEANTWYTVLSETDLQKL